MTSYRRDYHEIVAVVCLMTAALFIVPAIGFLGAYLLTQSPDMLAPQAVCALVTIFSALAGSYHLRSAEAWKGTNGSRSPG
jgi:hypothetical protein